MFDLMQNDLSWILKCKCNENPNRVLDWAFLPPKDNLRDYVLSENNSTVLFHPEYSCGTVIVRGDRSLPPGVHYWELKVLSPVYGTDIMIGFGTTDVDLNSKRSSFCSALGVDSKSWGFSYRSLFFHNSCNIRLSSGFIKGSIVGVLLDSWHGSYTVYLDGEPLLAGTIHDSRLKQFYPLICSTAAKSGFRLIYAKSSDITLQILACYAMRDHFQLGRALFDISGLPPGIRVFLKNNMPWLKYRRNDGNDQDHDDEDDDDFQKCTYCHPPDTSPKKTTCVFISSDIVTNAHHQNLLQSSTPGSQNSMIIANPMISSSVANQSTADILSMNCTPVSVIAANKQPGAVSSHSAVELTTRNSNDYCNSSRMLPRLRPLYDYETIQRQQDNSSEDWISVENSSASSQQDFMMMRRTRAHSPPPSHLLTSSTVSLLSNEYPYRLLSLWEEYGDPESLPHDSHPTKLLRLSKPDENWFQGPGQQEELDEVGEASSSTSQNNNSFLLGSSSSPVIYFPAPMHQVDSPLIPDFDIYEGINFPTTDNGGSSSQNQSTALTSTPRHSQERPADHQDQIQ